VRAFAIERKLTHFHIQLFRGVFGERDVARHAFTGNRSVPDGFSDVLVHLSRRASQLLFEQRESIRVVREIR
jgi:hypothetical protein